MNTKTLVSVIILNYNGLEYIDETIQSVLNSTYPNIEIIFADNCSTDGSFKHVTQKYGNIQKIKCIKTSSNLFYAGGNNYAVRYISGKYIVFLNSDCVVDKDWLQPLVNCLELNHTYIVQPKIVKYQNYKIIDSVGGKYIWPGIGRAVGFGEKDTNQYNQNRQFDYVNGTCLMISTKFFKTLGGFDAWFRFYYEDVDLCLRAKKQGGQSWYIHDSLVSHKVSQSITRYWSGSKLELDIKKNLIKTIQKNYKYANKYIRIICLLTLYIPFLIRDALQVKNTTIKAITMAFHENT